MSKISREKKKKKQGQLEKLGLLPKTQCESCFEYFLKKDLHFGPDPFASEIYGDNTPTILCKKCYHESCMDI
jgi:hypothetical protein